MISSTTARIVNQNVNLFADNVVYPLQNLDKKIWAVALIALACLAACIVIGWHYYFAKKKTNNEPKNATPPNPQPLDKITTLAKTTSIIPTAETPKTENSDPTPPNPIETPKPVETPSESKTIAASFPTIEQSTCLLAQNDRFLKALSPFDRQVRMKSPIPVSHEEFLAYYTKQLRPISPIEQNTQSKNLKDLCKVLEKYRIDMPEDIQFIHTTCQEEIPGTAAYCRENTIYYSWLGKGLLAHELFHIYSSHHPEMRKKLYAIIGYQVCPPIATPESLQGKRVVNPDAPDLDAFITLKVRKETVQAVPIDLYDLNYEGKGKSTFLTGIYHKFAVVEPQDNGEVRFKLDEDGNPILFDFDDAENLVEQIGENTGYVDSPEEILAENFALLLNGGQAKTPWVIEKIKKCFID